MCVCRSCPFCGILSFVYMQRRLNCLMQFSWTTLPQDFHKKIILTFIYNASLLDAKFLQIYNFNHHYNFIIIKSVNCAPEKFGAKFGLSNVTHALSLSCGLLSSQQCVSMPKIGNTILQQGTYHHWCIYVHLSCVSDLTLTKLQ